MYYFKNEIIIPYDPNLKYCLIRGLDLPDRDAICVGYTVANNTFPNLSLYKMEDLFRNIQKMFRVLITSR